MAFRTLILAAALVLPMAHCCVYLMGEAPDSLVKPTPGTHWNYAFRGDNWDGVDGNNQAWVCNTGKKQSPINLYGYSSAKKSNRNLKSTWSYTPLKSNGSNIEVFNNGHTIQVQWKGKLKSDVKILAKDTVLDVLNATASDKLKSFPLTPLQFHFHSTSEHAVDGEYYPMEMHIVHSIPQSVLPGCPASGCLSVTAMMLKIADDVEADSAFLDAIWEVMPEREGLVNYMKKGRVLDLESMMPPEYERGYLQYAGSLTTPPCTEGLLWHVLKTPMPISVAQYNKYTRAVGLKECKKVGGDDQDEDAKEDGDDKPKTRRSALETFNSDAEARLAAFKKGSYTGFVHASELASVPTTTRRTSRKMLDSHSDSDGGNATYTCKIAGYYFTNRNLQPLNERNVLSFSN